MLVLSRKKGQCISIGRLIEVEVLEVAGGRVKLGFSAPPEMPIRRNEICGCQSRSNAAWPMCCAAGEFCPP